MARRRMGFRPSLKEQLRQSHQAQAFMAMGAPAEKREEAEARLEEMFPGVDIDAAHHVHKKRAAPRQLEAPVVAAISGLLALHPRVIWAARFNSGAASFNAANGKYQPIWFHRFLRSPEKMRMPDFFGLYATARTFKLRDPMLRTEEIALYVPLAIEAKAPGWTKPRDDREREQAAFLEMIRNCGGVALFATSADQVAEALR